MRRLAAVASVVALGISAIALLGWTLQVVALERLAPGLATMKANTALAIFCCAAGLLGQTRHSFTRTAAVAVAAGGATLAGASLLEILAGLDLHIDQALFLDPATAAAGHPGRPSPATALCLLCVGVAIAALRRFPRLAQPLATASLVLSTLALLGYAFGIEALYRVHAYSSMALHTATAIALLSVGALLSRPRQMLPALLLSRSRGGVLTRGLIPATVIVPLTAGWICLLGYRDSLYAPEFGFALFAMANIVTFALLIWINAEMLDSADVRRKRVERDRDQALVRERAAREAAETALAARDQLLSVVSHELRTPLQPVTLVAEALAARGDLPDDVRPDVLLIREQLHAEVALIDNLLDVVRLQEAKLSTAPELVKVDAVVAHVLEKLRPTFDAIPVTISVELLSGPHFVLGDGGRLHQMVDNLLSNAAKFTPAGGRVQVKVESRAGRLRFSVSDTGIGISPEAMPRLFNVFEQADLSTRRRFGGLGLGLVISRRLAEMHGGTLTAESSGVDLGTTFTLDLPLAHPPAVALLKTPVQPTPSRSIPSSRRLLLVEDNPQTLSLLKRLLTSKGYQVVPASSAFEAVTAVDESPHPFDVLVSDIGMPDLNGWDMMELLGGRAPPRSIAVSGFVGDSDRQRSLAVGFAEHLPKPVDLDRLLRAIETPAMVA